MGVVRTQHCTGVHYRSSDDRQGYLRQGPGCGIIEVRSGIAPTTYRSTIMTDSQMLRHSIAVPAPQGRATGHTLTLTSSQAQALANLVAMARDIRDSAGAADAIGVWSCCQRDEDDASLTIDELTNMLEEWEGG